LRKVHNWPHFERNPDAVYSQLVYSAKSTDVMHVMCNGKWLMRNRELLTINTNLLLDEADEYAHQIDKFLTDREGDILSRLLAIGEIQREESFEIQVKVKVDNATPVEHLLTQTDFKVVKSSHFRQHDTYFEFAEPTPARIRYREDDYIDEKGSVTNVRTRLTLTETGDQRELPGAILLSRSRYISPATRTLRFYREYFKANSERTIVKVRRRWHVEFNGKLFYFNLDRLTEPAQGDNFLEIKARTWSLKDAEEKAKDILAMLSALGIDRSRLVLAEYVSI
jgi:5-methylthioadenosine/S-adenosylhomocysteine deaminase